MAIETDLPDLAYDLGLTRKQREMIGRELPSARNVRQRTRISDEDAQMLRDAAKIAALSGLAIVVIVRLLASGVVKPNVP